MRASVSVYGVPMKPAPEQPELLRVEAVEGADGVDPPGRPPASDSWCPFGHSFDSVKEYPEEGSQVQRRRPDEGIALSSRPRGRHSRTAVAAHLATARAAPSASARRPSPPRRGTPGRARTASRRCGRERQPGISRPAPGALATRAGPGRAAVTVRVVATGTSTPSTRRARQLRRSGGAPAGSHATLSAGGRRPLPSVGASD